jgi:hypothetical protein
MRLLPDFHTSGLNVEEIIALMVADGITYQEIANYVSWDRKAIGRYATANLANSGFPTGIALRVDSTNGKFICHVCKKRVTLKNLPARIHNGKKLYALSYCKECESVNPEENPLIEKSLARTLALKEQSIRNNHGKDKTKLPYGYFSFLYLKQQGLCFYTDLPLSFKTNEDIQNTISVDRVIFDGLYEQGNIVFALQKINQIKLDMTVEEMSNWTPKWHSRAINFLNNTEEYLLGE